MRFGFVHRGPVHGGIKLQRKRRVHERDSAELRGISVQCHRRLQDNLHQPGGLWEPRLLQHQHRKLSAQGQHRRRVHSVDRLCFGLLCRWRVLRERVHGNMPGMLDDKDWRQRRPVPRSQGGNRS